MPFSDLPIESQSFIRKHCAGLESCTAKDCNPSGQKTAVLHGKGLESCTVVAQQGLEPCTAMAYEDCWHFSAGALLANGI